MAKVMVTREAPAVSRDHALLANTLQDSCMVGRLPAKWWESNFCLHCLADGVAFSISAAQTVVAHIRIIGSRSSQQLASFLFLFFLWMIGISVSVPLPCTSFSDHLDPICRCFVVFPPAYLSIVLCGWHDNLQRRFSTRLRWQAA